MGWFSKDVGIDLGTANTLIYVKGKGIVLREPSVVAINRNNKEVLAVGFDAKEMVGKTPENIVAVRPLSEGVISDFNITHRMISFYLKKVLKGSFFARPRVVACVPAGVTDVERRALEEAVIQSGAKEVYIIEESMASAIGANLPVVEPVGNMVLDIGGGTSEVAVVSLGSIVTSKTVRVAGNAFDESIINYIKKQHNLLIGDRTAENVKINIGSVYFDSKEEIQEMVIRGRDLLTGLPKNRIINSREIMEAFDAPVRVVLDALKATLENTPPELASDIVERGITLTGGGALLRGLDKLISSETGLDVKIADNPLDCVAKGAGILLEEIDTLKIIQNDRKSRGYPKW